MALMREPNKNTSMQKLGKLMRFIVLAPLNRSHAKTFEGVLHFKTLARQMGQQQHIAAVSCTCTQAKNVRRRLPSKLMKWYRSVCMRIMRMSYRRMIPNRPDLMIVACE
eukprot:5011071-Amphidinium_carterae.1